jgi:hypothetical protein
LRLRPANKKTTNIHTKPSLTDGKFGNWNGSAFVEDAVSGV